MAHVLVSGAIGAALGLVVGVAFFRALRANTRLYFTSVPAAVALHLARQAVAAGAFVALAALRPGALLPALGACTLAGLSAGRRAAEPGTP